MVGFKFAPAKIKAYLQVLLQTITNFLNLTRKEKQWLPFLALYQMDTETFFSHILPCSNSAKPMSQLAHEFGSAKIDTQPAKQVFSIRVEINY